MKSRPAGVPRQGGAPGSQHELLGPRGPSHALPHAEGPKLLNCSSCLQGAPSTGKDKRVKHCGAFISVVSRDAWGPQMDMIRGACWTGPSVSEILPCKGEQFGESASPGCSTFFPHLEPLCLFSERKITELSKQKGLCPLLPVEGGLHVHEGKGTSIWPGMDGWVCGEGRRILGSPSDPACALHTQGHE